jgi:drug/metabolite transporter (DMT)-like permease
MVISTEAVVLLAVIASGISAVMSALIKKESEEHSALLTSYMVILFAVFFLTPYIAYKIYFTGFSYSFFSLFAAVLAGILGTGKTWLGVKAFQLIDFSVAQPMKKLAPLFVVGAELAIIGLKPSYLLLLGVALTVVGAYVLLIDSEDVLSPLKNLHKRGVQAAVLSAVFSAAGALSIRLASGTIPEYGVTYLWYTANLMSLFAVLSIKGKTPSLEMYRDRNFLSAGLLSSVAGVVSVFLYSVASSVSLVTAVYQSSVLFSVLIGGKIFQEDKTLIRLVGAIIIVSGIILLSQV